MFKVGDRVRFLDEPGEGVVLAVSDQEVTVESEDGFALSYSASSLIQVKEMPLQDEGEWYTKDQDRQNGPRPKPTQNRPNLLECDLHFGQLVDYPKNYSNHQKLQIQLREAEKALAKAKRASIKRVVLIHGVGQGRLKEEVHSLLERKDGLTFYDASFAEYGSGATEVQLF